MKNFCLAIGLFISTLSFSQIKIDSALVYMSVEKIDIKETELLFTFFQLSGSNFNTERLPNSDMESLNLAINRATNMTFAIPKLPKSAFFMRCTAEATVYGFAVLADKHLMIDAAHNIKLVFENKDDIAFLDRLQKRYSVSQLHWK